VTLKKPIDLQPGDKIRRDFTSFSGKAVTWTVIGVVTDDRLIFVVVSFPEGGFGLRTFPKSEPVELEVIE
jgi:hypothetical protein